MMSVVIPAFNEEESVGRAAQTVAGVLREAGISYELIFVDDGSGDGTWEAVLAANREDGRVRGIAFSRNFGKDRAIFAGLAGARGDCVAVMDCDLQHPPELLPEMYRLWGQGIEVVEGVKGDRGRESGLHRLCAGAFYAVLGRLAGLDMESSSDFKLLDRKAVEAVLAMPEEEVFFRGLAAFVGFKRAKLEFDVAPRTAGRSKWSFRSLARYGLGAVASFSTAPMLAPAVIGAVFALAAGVTGVLYAALAEEARGWLVFIGVALMLGVACVLMSLGILGVYVGRAYRQSLGRPRYIISRECGDGT